VTKICKVLLVEDQHDLQLLLRELFALEGYRFRIVEDGAAMRRTLDAEEDIDIVVIDILLPGGADGLTLAKEVAEERGLPVILVTGDHQQVEKLDASGHRYLLKPFRIASFLELIETVLREAKNTCERAARSDEQDCGAGPLSP